MSDEKPISEETPIRLKVVIAIAAAALGLLTGLCGAVWWASSVSHQLTTIVAQNAAIVAAQNSTRLDVSAIDGRLKDIESWKKMIDQQGDPAGRVRSDALEKEINLLRHDLDILQAKGRP